MTKILLSAIVTDMRNSTAGTTFTKNRYGNVMKKKQTPVKQTTEFQNYWRQGQAGIAQRWRTLSDSDRQTWIDGSSNFPYQDSFGNTVFLSGFSLYQKLNLNLRIINENPIDTCPAADSTPTFQDFFVLADWDAVNDRYEITVGNSSEQSTVDFKCVIYATQPASQGKMTAGKTNYFVQNWEAATEGTDISQNFKQFFGNPAVGQKSFFQIFMISKLTGQRSVSLTTSLIFPVH